jgi:hypothetical protein
LVVSEDAKINADMYNEAYGTQSPDSHFSNIPIYKVEVEVELDEVDKYYLDVTSYIDTTNSVK